jgi:hypothetical protein
MLAAFWSAVGGKLADRWVAVSIPAVVFWLGGLAAWAYHLGGLHALATRGWPEGQPAVVQVAALVLVLLVVGASGLVVERAATPALRLLEGYWPPISEPLRRRLIDLLASRASGDADKWQKAYGRVRADDVTATDLAAFSRLERRRRRRPAQAAYFLPTPIGNILRAAERRPADKYGLDAIVIWPQLWLLLPDATRTELRAARVSLDGAVAAAIWGVLFCLFAPLALAAVPVGLAVTVIAVWAVIPARAQVFGELIEAAYDLHRTQVYQHLRWPLPVNPHAERAAGAALTSYLRRGSDGTAPTFTPPV